MMLKNAPTSHVYFSQRLRLHYVDWGNSDAPTMLLVHGGRDHCRNWDWVAENLRSDYHIIAPDLRGHGDSQWNIGGAYTTIDYVYDIAQLLFQTTTKPVTIIGHSLGGAVSLTYAGLYPETVDRIISIEGMGPIPRTLQESSESTSSKVTNWIGNLRKLSARLPKRYETLGDAYHRMQNENPHLTSEQARHLTVHGSNQNEDGTFSWKFDNYVRTFPPIGLTPDETYELYSRIVSPTLLIYGKESWASKDSGNSQSRYFQDATTELISDAGHWVHHDQLEEFLATVRAFLNLNRPA